MPLRLSRRLGHNTMAVMQMRLRLVRLLHTIVWAFFVACILAIPVYAQADRYGRAALFIGIVLIETLVLMLNRWRCPLTDVAARYTADQHVGFDIYLPTWLARNNKLIFGSIFAVGTIFAVVRWVAYG